MEVQKSKSSEMIQYALATISHQALRARWFLTITERIQRSVTSMYFQTERSGASKKPDPKMIRHAGTEFITHGDKCKCTTCSARPEDWKMFV
jgi:rubredoxin